MRKSVLVIVFIVFTATTLFWTGRFVLTRIRRPQAMLVPTAEAVAQIRLPAKGDPLPIFWDAPAFAYPDQNGHILTDKDLRGRVWISDFFFATCATACPIMTANMSRLQRAITNPNVEFVSFSVDPDHDTPAVLKEYARMWKADDVRWHFLSTEREKLAETVAGMKTFVRPPVKDTPIRHSTLFILIDGNGRVRGVYDSSDEATLDRLAYDASVLAGGPSDAGYVAWPTPKSGNDSGGPGAVLYASLGCVACHAQERVAPSLTGCFGRSVQLDDGRTVTADEAYIRESILDPNAKVVAGYPRLMPSYRGQLTDWDLGELVDYIKSLSAGPAAPFPLRTSQPARPSTTLPATTP